MKLSKIKKLREKYDIQLRVLELTEIIRTIEKKPVNFLVFGLGNDTKIWSTINKGKTVFLEDLDEWYEKIIKKNPKIIVYKVKYYTKREDWKKLLKNPEKLMMKLPKEVLDTKWDVILVDAPRGWKDGQPGRMQSIYTTSKLMKNGHVFVHDCDREVEAYYSNKFLKKKNFVKEVKGLRHYKI